MLKIGDNFTLGTMKAGGTMAGKIPVGQKDLLWGKFLVMVKREDDGQSGGRCRSVMRNGY
jgi:hypothetical protein